MGSLNDDPMGWLKGRLVDENEPLPPREPLPSPRSMPRKRTVPPVPQARFADGPGPQGSHNPRITSPEPPNTTMTGGGMAVPATDRTPQPAGRNVLLDEVLSYYKESPNTPIHYLAVHQEMRKRGLTSSHESVNQVLVRMHQQAAWGVSRVASGTYMFTPPGQQPSYPSAMSSAPPPLAQARLAPVPPPAVPEPQQLSYTRTSRFTFVGTSADGTLIIKDGDDNLFKAQPL